jgi:hypothetical protein
VIDPACSEVATGEMTGETTGETGETTGETDEMTGETTAETGETTAVTVVPGPDCSGNRELDGFGLGHRHPMLGQSFMQDRPSRGQTSYDIHYRRRFNEHSRRRFDERCR